MNRFDTPEVSHNAFIVKLDAPAPNGSPCTTAAECASASCENGTCCPYCGPCGHCDASAELCLPVGDGERCPGGTCVAGECIPNGEGGAAGAPASGGAPAVSGNGAAGSDLVVRGGCGCSAGFEPARDWLVLLVTLFGFTVRRRRQLPNS